MKFSAFCSGVALFYIVKLRVSKAASELRAKYMQNLSSESMEEASVSGCGVKVQSTEGSRTRIYKEHTKKFGLKEFAFN